MLLSLGYLLFPPSPATLTSMTYVNEIQSDLVARDFTGALVHANQGLVAMPGNVTLMILKGIAQTRLGEIVDGTQSFVKAEVLVNDPESYLLQRALIYLRIGDWVSVINDAQVVVKLDPQSAEGFFLLGTAYDNLHQLQKAYNAFADADRLANAQRDYPLLYAIQMNKMNILPYVDEGTKQVLSTP